MGSPAFAADMQKVGVVGSLNGSITAVIPGNPSPQTLKVGDAIYLNQTIRAGKDSSAQLMFLDKSSLTIVPDTEITIDTFVYDPANSVGKMSVKGAKGTFRFIGGALSKQDAVTLKTPVSTIGIRGGIVQVSIVLGSAGAAPQVNAIFFYGRDMSVQSAGGSVVTTTEFGRGIATRSNGVTEPMKPEEVKVQVRTFNTQSAQPTAQPVDMNKPAVNPLKPGAPPPPNPDDPNAPPPTEPLDPSASTTEPMTTDPMATEPLMTEPLTTEPMMTEPLTGMIDPNIIDTGISPGATTGSNTIINTTGGGATGDPADPANWGIWAHQSFLVHFQNPTTPVPTVISTVTGQPYLTGNLPSLPAIFSTFGTVNYNGAVEGAIQVGAATPTPVIGTFSSQIDFNTRLLNNLNITMGGFTIGTSTPTGSLSPIPISGTYTDGGTYSAMGSADLGLYGANADLLAGKFTATAGAVSTSAEGALVGGKQ